MSGADVTNPARFRDRKLPAKPREIGEPYAAMTEAQRRCWHEFRAELPWLTSSHRVIVRLACILAARMETDPEFGVQATQALGSILSKLGATPVDASKVGGRDDEPEDPTDRFFSKPH